MRALIVKDNGEKSADVASALKASCPHCEIIAVSNQAAAVRELDARPYDIIILDVMLPSLEGGTPVDNGADFVKEVSKSRLNTGAQIVALTAYENVYDTTLDKFLSAGVIVLQYSKDARHWQATLQQVVNRVKRAPRKDFIIICGLAKERRAFMEQGYSSADIQIVGGLDVAEISIGGRSGFIVVPPRMGLVDASVVTALAVKLFDPKLVAIAGICGGFSKNAKLAQLVVATDCWEHQTGKITPQGHSLEFYPWSMGEPLRLVLNNLSSQEDFEANLYKAIRKGRKYKTSPTFAPVLSGSAVIADKKTARAIFKQHRKAAGVDMEMFGVFRAVQVSKPDTLCFGAKTVVDFADTNKDDSVHSLGATVSARFVVRAIEAAFLSL